MKNIDDMRVSQARLYPTDSLPHMDIIRLNAKSLKEAFAFESVNTDPFGLSIIFQNGSVKVDHSVAQVMSVVFEPRKITIGVRGVSKVADKVCDGIHKLLRSFDTRTEKQEYQPLVKVEDTSCVCTLAIDFDELIASSFAKYMQGEVAAKLRTVFSVPKSIAFKNLTFEVRYEATDTRLEEHEITLANKSIVIEPRASTPLQERRFFVSSPTDSETHLSILRGLEAAIKSGRQKRVD